MAKLIQAVTEFGPRIASGTHGANPRYRRNDRLTHLDEPRRGRQHLE